MASEGLPPEVWSLLARYHGPFTGDWLGRVPGVRDFVFLLATIDPDRPPAIVGVLPALAQGFPCGYVVDPD